MKVLLITFIIGASISCYGQYHSPGSIGRVDTFVGDRISPKYTFTIVLKNDSTFQKAVAINVYIKPQALWLKLNGKKRYLFPADTKEIYRITPEGYKVTGVPADSCWLFDVVRDKKINGYSDIAVRNGYDYVIAIQAGNNAPIIPLTAENLKAMIGETTDEELIKLLKKNKIHEALRRYNGDVK